MQTLIGIAQDRLEQRFEMFGELFDGRLSKEIGTVTPETGHSFRGLFHKKRQIELSYFIVVR